MPDDHPYRKPPSVADLKRKRVADEAGHVADKAAMKLRSASRALERRTIGAIGVLISKLLAAQNVPAHERRSRRPSYRLNFLSIRRRV
jgi:hypothetical protein